MSQGRQPAAGEGTQWGTRDGFRSDRTIVVRVLVPRPLILLNLSLPPAASSLVQGLERAPHNPTTLGA